MKQKIIALLFFTLMIPCFVAPSSAVTYSTSMVADMDTFVDSAFPGSNYGTQNLFHVGENILDGVYEAYFHFNFTSKPDDWTQAVVSIYIYQTSTELNLSACVVNELWGEDTLNASIAPPHGPLITTFLVTDPGNYTLDVTGTINESREWLSICVY